MKLPRVFRYSSLLLFAACSSFGAEVASSDCKQYTSDVKAIVPSFVSFGAKKDLRVALLDKDGKTVGYLLLAPAGSYERVEGFNGTVNAAVLVSPQDRVLGVAAGHNEETPRFFKRVRKSTFLKQWNGKSLKDAAAVKVEAVSRATFSSQALEGEVKAILNAAMNKSK